MTKYISKNKLYEAGYKDAVDKCNQKIVEMLKGAKQDIETIKDEVRKHTGSFKWDSCYDDCIMVLDKLTKATELKKPFHPKELK